MWGAPPAGPCTPASVTLPSSRPTLSKCHPPQPQQSPSPFLFLCSCSRGRTSGLSISAMFWALLARHPRLAVTRGVPMHIAAPLAEPVLTPNSCADRSPATREQLLLKLQPGQKQEPALAKHQLGARNSPGTHTCHLLSTNFTARGIQSMAAQLCHGQRGKSHFFGANSTMAFVFAVVPSPFPRLPGQPSVPGGRHSISPNLGSQQAAQCVQSSQLPGPSWCLYCPLPWPPWPARVDPQAGGH